MIEIEGRLVASQDGMVIYRPTWIECSDRLPERDPNDPDDRGWRLCHFGGHWFASARYVKEHEKWQLANYSWAMAIPKRWTLNPNKNFSSSPKEAS